VLIEQGIGTAHFEASTARMRVAPRPRRPLSEILVAGARTTDTHRLKRRLIEEGIFEARCTGCGLDRWLEGPIPLQLDHIDGDRTNNLLENLRLLCPNCHALTDTYCGRNIGRR
jgi:5-methylcytosine-specific restriction endonuclease McrA